MTLTPETPAYYAGHDRCLVSVDCVIFTVRDKKLNVLLAPRPFEPRKGEWSLLGGFVGAQETLDEAAQRVLRELTGLDNIYMEQVGAFGSIDRDPFVRVISVAYCALIQWSEDVEATIENHNGHWADITELPPVCFDHPIIIQRTLANLRGKVLHEPVVFNMLPELFTLTQLQVLIEQILGQPVDKRNFRRRVSENPSIERTELIDKLTSRRGASLYRFNPEALGYSSKFKI